MSPLNVAICTTISYTLWVEWYYLKKQLFDLQVKGQGLMKVIMVTVSLLVKETGVPGENHWPAANHWQTLSHDVASSTPHMIQTHNVSGERHWLHR